MKELKIGVLLYTYNRVQDVKINMEIIRGVWSKLDILKNVKIVHAYNGLKEWWPEKYLEDELIFLPNPGHFEGADILMSEGIKVFSEKYSYLDYIIILAADTWLVKPDFLQDILLSMALNNKFIATSVWGSKNSGDIWKQGCALDFLIINLDWATKGKLFPLRYSDFKGKYEELFLYHNQFLYLELVFMVRYKQAIQKTMEYYSENNLIPLAEKHIYRIREREPIHILKTRMSLKRVYLRETYWPKLGMLCHHIPDQKQKALKEWNLGLGEYGKQFLKSNDLSYYIHPYLANQV
jgi:hypothetical protein